MGWFVDILPFCVDYLGAEHTAPQTTTLKTMQTTTTTVNRTVVRHPAHLIITGYSITASDPYSEENRETVEIVGDGDQIVSELTAWVTQRHRDAQGGSGLAKQDLARLAGAMGLDYPAATGEA